MLVSACTIKAIPAKLDLQEVHCAGWFIIYIDADKDTEETQIQIENHNDFYVANCTKEKAKK